ncbi:hypothetical protein K2173_025196 [Erythroxylum novogranatense]|uniref:Pentatricopeptide repeat-containing protein n=1 Tax=Erythroxylum novogranatense TaxID=1862640 RepID=A0AAV8UD94_9ROSI|nr:hypothetical protein K2173_025196 [Erythroxylum novogranatense]
MLIHLTKLAKVCLRSNVFPSPSVLSSVFFFSSYDQTSSKPIKDVVFHVSALINKPKWEDNTFLKSLVSHMSPHEACKTIELQSNNDDLGVRFFQWICKQSTYCYDIDSRVHLLKLIVFCNLYAVAHKAIVFVIKECTSSEDDILKLMGALDELREIGFRLNYPCYSNLLMCLAKVSLGFLAFLVYNRMVADGFVLGGIDYRNVVNGLCKNGFVQAGEMFLSRALKLGFGLDTHLCTSLVMGYCRENLLEQALMVLDVMSQWDGCQPNSVTYSTLIHGLCEAGKIEDAFGLKNEMNEKGLPPSARTYTILMKAMCDIGLVDKAFSLLDEMITKQCKPNIHAYTVLIEGLCREGKLEEAHGMFRRMLQERLFPRIITYNVLINGYCKEGRIISAFEVLSLMEKRKCKPNIRTYNELIGGLCRVSKSYKALFLLRRIVDNGYLPTEVTYNILIDGFCKEGKLDAAFSIFRSMKLVDLQPDRLTFTSIIDGLCKQRRPEMANGILGLMVKEGISPDEITFTALMDGYCKIGKTVDASMLYEWMMEFTYLTSPHAFNLYLDILCKENRLKEEYAMFGKILKLGLVPSVVTYTILINGLCQAGNITHSLKMLDLMQQSGCAPNVYTYTVVIHGLCEFGRIQEADALLFHMLDFGVQPNHITYSILVKAHVVAGRVDQAFEIMSLMVKNGCQPNSVIYSALLAGYAMSNTTTKVDNLDPPVESEEDGISENHIARNINVELAFELGDKIEKYGGSAIDFCDFLVEYLCRCGRVTEADCLVRDKVKKGLFPDKAASSVIEWHCRKQQYRSCLDLMKWMLSSGFVPCFESYHLVIEGLCSVGNSEQAKILIADLLTYNGVHETALVSPYVDFLVKEDNVHPSQLIEQLHHIERPVL